MKTFKLSNRSLTRLIGVKPWLVAVAKRAIKITLIDFGIPQHGGKRLAEEQYQLFLDGVSKADGINDLSKHQSGGALDYYAIDPETGKASWDIGLMGPVACAFYQAAMELEREIEWGGLWPDDDGKAWDLGHIQEQVGG